MTIILVLPNKCILSKVSKMTMMKNSTTLTRPRNEGQDPKLMSKRPTNGKLSLLLKEEQVNYLAKIIK